MKRVLWISLAALIPAVALAGEEPAEAPSKCKVKATCDKADDVRDEYVKRSFKAATAKDRYALGLWCRQNGMLPESRAQFGAAARLDPSLAAARTELGEKKVDGRWMPSETAMKAKGLVRYEGSWVLPEEKAWLDAPATEKERLRLEQDRARKLIETMATGRDAAVRAATKALDGVENAAKMKPLAMALRARSQGVRLYAAKALGSIRDRRSLNALVKRSMVDPVAEVRNASFDAAKAIGDPNLIGPYVNALFSIPNDKVRAAAAAAIGRSGDVRGMDYLVYRIEGHGGGPRAHIYTANQISFVQDFDVEVAQTAFIADPMVGILQEGAVLDVKVVSSEWYATAIEKQAIYGSLRELAGNPDIEDTPTAWRNWMRENRTKETAKR